MPYSGLDFQVEVLQPFAEGVAVFEAVEHLPLNLCTREKQCAFITLFFTLVTGPIRSLSLELSDTRVYAPQMRLLLIKSSMARPQRPCTTHKGPEFERMWHI